MRKNKIGPRMTRCNVTWTAKKEEVNLSDREINKWKIYLSRQPKRQIIYLSDIICREIVM